MLLCAKFEHLMKFLLGISMFGLIRADICLDLPYVGCFQSEFHIFSANPDEIEIYNIFLNQSNCDGDDSALLTLGGFYGVQYLQPLMQSSCKVLIFNETALGETMTLNYGISLNGKIIMDLTNKDALTIAEILMNITNSSLDSNSGKFIENSIPSRIYFNSANLWYDNEITINTVRIVIVLLSATIMHCVSQLFRNRAILSKIRWREDFNMVAMLIIMGESSCELVVFLIDPIYSRGIFTTTVGLVLQNLFYPVSLFAILYMALYYCKIVTDHAKGGVSLEIVVKNVGWYIISIIAILFVIIALELISLTFQNVEEFYTYIAVVNVFIAIVSMGIAIFYFVIFLFIMKIAKGYQSAKKEEFNYCKFFSYPLAIIFGILILQIAFMIRYTNLGTFNVFWTNMNYIFVHLGPFVYKSAILFQIEDSKRAINKTGSKSGGSLS